MSDSPIDVELLLEGGQSQALKMTADAPELTRMFQILGARGTAVAEEQFFQLPLEGGEEAFSFNSAQLIAIRTRPPVLVDFQPLTSDGSAPEAVDEVVAAPDASYQRTQYQVVDNFLGHYEHADMLAYALQHEADFQPGTVNNDDHTARTNRVILGFAEAAHSTLIRNRLLTWLPQLWQLFHMTPFPVSQVESQLTVSGDGHYFRAHVDSDSTINLDRALTCIYYFSRQPQQFSGGNLRIYDSVVVDGQRRQAADFTEIEPVSNRLVVFPSDTFHELLPIRCPSQQFADSRFAVTNWIWQSSKPEPRTDHGWGFLRYGRVPTDWWHRRDASS